MARQRPHTRLYIARDIPAHGVFDAPPEQAHHVVHVLRLTQGDVLTVFDGRGNEYPTRIERIERSRVTLKVGAARPVDRESPLVVTLAQGISSGERMDYTVQKAVELGVCAIQPLAVERSVVKLSIERAAKRIAHWQSIAAAACEQCGRNRIPPVRPVADFRSWLAVPRADALQITLSPDAALTFRDLERPRHDLVLLVGPEGGLSPNEQQDAQHAGFTSVRLGPRVLRTETAAVAALAAMQTLWGDF